MNRNRIIARADEILRERVPLDEVDATAIEYLKTCVERCRALDEAPALFAPIINIRDKKFSNAVRKFGEDIHDRLRIARITETGTCDGEPCTASANLLMYYNLQNYDGSFGGYEIETDDAEGNIPTRRVVEINDKIFPEQGNYCEICGDDKNLHYVCVSSGKKLGYCDKCKDALKIADLVSEPTTNADILKNFLIITQLITQRATGELDEEL